MMVAAAKYRMEAKPDIVVLQDVRFTPAEMQDVAAVVGKDLFTDELRETLGQFEQAKNFGSLIMPKLRDPAETLRVVEARDFGSDLLLKEVQERVVAVLRLAEALSPKYHVVVANPPYMGNGGMNPKLKSWIERNYPSGKSDLMTAFIIACQSLSRPKGTSAIVTLDSWMFLSSFKELRQQLIRNASIQTLMHVGWNCFPDGHVYNRGVGFTVRRGAQNGTGQYINLSNVPAVVDKQTLFHERMNAKDLISVKNKEFLKVPASPIAYWLPNFSVFQGTLFRDVWTSGGRLKTHGSDKYIRYIWETSKDKCHWRRLTKGGEVRKHYGNEEHLVDWSTEAVKHYDSVGGLYPESFQGKEGITWTKVTSANPTFRIKRDVAEYDSGGPVIFNADFRCDYVALAALNSHATRFFLDAINPTINTQVNDVLSLPIANLKQNDAAKLDAAERRLVALAKSDWDSYETSWDFTTLPLLSPDHRAGALATSYYTHISQVRR